ncbi:phosphatase PAP2 family protein [Pseudoxanthomonas suwonensis]|uniref:phosphatase PAP2 family protein n=1 Tax=Pseudoxanthomonas suwonensis TaxID=314722 RepID=UPI000467D0FA
MHGRPAEPQARSFLAALRGRWRRLALLFLGLLLPLWLFAELADEIHEMEALVFDDALLLRVHAWTSPLLDRVFVWSSLAGYRYGVVPLDIAIALGLLLARRWREAAFASVSFVGSALLNLGTKQFFQRERPSLWDSIAPETTFSFPSGHAMGSATLAAVVVLLAWHTRWRWPVLLLAALFTGMVGVSRMYLGVHYPSDVLGGWAAGLAWTSGVYLVLFRARRPWRRRH